MRLLKGDLSAPVLAVIVTIGVISAGLVIMAWFWWFAPLAGRTGALMIVGTPVIFYNMSNSEAILTLALRNTGNTDVTVRNVMVLGVEGNAIDTKQIGPGKTETLTVRFNNLRQLDDKYTVEGVVVTDVGTYTFVAKVIKS